MNAKIGAFLNNITMYRLLLSGLSTLAGISLVLSIFKVLPYGVLPYVYSLTLVISVSYLSNYFFAKIFKAPVNRDSAFITALILFLILSPVLTFADALVVMLAAVLASGSKYFLAIDYRHLFNPAAFALLILGLCGSGNAFWWVASPWLLLPVLVFGLLVVRKLRLWSLFGSFIFVYFGVVLVLSLIQGLGFAEIMNIFIERLVSWPIIFFGTIMLTEPFTLPPGRRHQIFYAALVAVLLNLTYSWGPLHFTPELALILGNIFAYTVSFRRRVILTLISKKEIAQDIYEFAFAPNYPFAFKAGQYLEWTLDHSTPDNRGERRYFTIASSPTEKEVKIGIKFAPHKSSSFKSELLSLESGDTIVAGQLAGEFLLPGDKTKKLVFIAGGIGVTPFRSMTKFLLDKKVQADIKFLYSSKLVSEFAYEEIFSQAEKDLNFKRFYFVTDETSNLPAGYRPGFITTLIVKQEIPDYLERIFYLSGPNAMVEAYKKMLLGMGVKGSNIVVDYFPGF